MEWHGFDLSDGWGAAGVLLALAAIVLGYLWQRAANERADESDKRTERLIEHTAKLTDAIERQTALSERDDEPGKDEEPVARIWLTENPTKNRFILRNMGPGTATGVTIDQSRIKCLVRDLPPKFDLAQNQGQPFVMIGTFQTGGPPSEIWVRSDQEPEWSVVALERWHK